MTKLGILSDTHGLLRPEVTEALKGCSAIFHGGDINRAEILDQLKEIAPLYVVRGNNDKDWAEDIPYVLEAEIEGLRVCMAHKKGDLPEDLTGYDLVICGHTHKYEERQLPHGGILLNPGSCGPRRFHQEITLAAVYADGGTVDKIEKIEKIEKIVIPHEGRMPEKPAGDMRSVIERVTKDVQRGKSVDEIAAERKIERELAEQICRLYLTHPGVDTDGIMTKMGL